VVQRHGLQSSLVPSRECRTLALPFPQGTEHALCAPQYYSVQYEDGEVEACVPDCLVCGLSSAPCAKNSRVAIPVAKGALLVGTVVGEVTVDDSTYELLWATLPVDYFDLLTVSSAAENQVCCRKALPTGFAPTAAERSAHDLM
jgi:hypothetical protein